MTAPATRAGTSLVEVIVAMAILGSALLSMGAFVARFVNTVSTSTLRTTAVELASDRLEAVKTAPRYSQIDSLYAGSESGLPGHPGFQRATMVAHVGGDSASMVDYRVVTVTVTGPGLRTPVAKTTVIAGY